MQRVLTTIRTCLRSEAAELRERTTNSFPLSGVSALQIFISLVCYLSFETTTAEAQDYVEITAEVELFSSQSNGSAAGTQRLDRRFSLVCIVGTNKWRIENNFSKNAQTKWLFDGTNIYDSRLMTKAPSELITSDAKRKGLAVVPFEIARSNLTIGIDTASEGCSLGDVGVNIPWLAFCSGPFLRREGRVIPMPVAHVNSAPDGFASSDRTQTFDDELGLPMKVELFTSKSLYKSSVTRFNHDHFVNPQKATPVESRLQDGLLKFSYTITASTNFMGWNIPLRFEYFQNEIRHDGTVERRYSGIGSVSLIRPSHEPESVFDLTMRQTVIDRRFRSADRAIGALIYDWTNAFAAPTNDPSLQKLFAEQAAQAEPRPSQTVPRPGVSRGFVIALLLITAIVPITILLLRKPTQTTKTL